MADLTGALTLATSATRRSSVGSYAIAAEGLTSPNYDIAYVGAPLTVSPAPLTVTAEAKTRRYGADNPRLTASIEGFVLGEGSDDLAGALSLSTTATRRSGVGTYTITAGGLTSANYAISYADASLTVTPASLTVTADAKSRTYGAENSRLTASVEGFVLNDDLSDLGGDLTLATPTTRRSGVGTYPITASGLTSENYAISYANGPLTITPAPLTVTVRAKSRTYGADNPHLTASVKGFVLGENKTDLNGELTLTTSAMRRSGVGSYAITPDGLNSPNYDTAYVDGALLITPAPLTVTADAKSRRYGGGNPRLTATIGGFVLGEDVADLAGALTLATSATRRSGVGSYAIAVEGLSSPNYDIAYANGALTVTPAPLTVTADDAARPGGAANPVFTARYEGFVLGESQAALDGTLGFFTEATPASPAGGYAVTPGGLSSANYAIAYENGLLTVTPSSILIAPRQGLRAGYEIAGRGAPPFTPGDSAFRTIPAEAPTAMASTFELIYSLGEIPQLAAGADTGGFVPAAGGAEAAPCAPSAWAGSAADCAPPSAESFWTTAFPERAR